MNISPVVRSEEGMAAIDAEENVVNDSIKIVAERAPLLKALGYVQSVVEKKHTLPILANVKLEAKNGILYLGATNLEIEVSDNIPAQVEVEGALTVSAHTLYDIVRKLPEGSQIAMEGSSSGNSRLTIVSGNSDFKLSCLPAADFPKMEAGEMDNTFSLASSELSMLIEKTIYCSSTEETRYYLNGIYMEAVDDIETPVLRTVAADGHRLAKTEITLPEGAASMPGIIIPKKTAIEAKKLADAGDDEVEISLSKTKICFSKGNTVLLSKLIDGSFPDYNKVIPQNNDKTMEVDRKLIFDAVNRMASICNERTMGVRFILERNKLILSAVNHESNFGHEELDVIFDYDEKIDTGYNTRYLLEVLAGIEGNKVFFVFADQGTAPIISDPADFGTLSIIMPMTV